MIAEYGKRWKVYIQCLQKVFRSLHFLHILLCCRFNFKRIKLPFLHINLHSISHNDKVKMSEIFAILLKIKN
ncbi:hypothetical protein LDENG_00143120 [Lucifuga dentata]|nr:hypothetical protein LDENG_00143120 [Lucifuga dentata]